MVTERTRNERGQLLLVGGIAIALVIVGGVVLLNSMAFTNTVGSQGNQDVADDAERTVDMMQTDLQALTERVRKDSQIGNFEENIEENLSTYAKHYTRLSFDNGIVYTDVRLNKDESRPGTVLVQNETEDECDDQFDGGRLPRFKYHTNATNSDDCDDLTVEDVESTRQFNLSIRRFPCDDTDPPSSNLTVAVTNSNDASESWEVRFASEYTGGGNCKANENAPGNATRYIEIYDANGDHEVTYSEAKTWFPDSGAVAVDLQDGTVEDEPIPELDFTDDVSAPYDIELRNEKDGRGNEYGALGTYRLWTDGDGPDNRNTLAEQPVLEDKNLTTVAVDIVYQRPELVYNRTVLLDEEG